MKTVDLSQSDPSVSECTRRLRTGPLVLTRRGRPVAALIRVTDADLETLLLSENAKFQAIIRRSRVAYKRKGGIKLAEAQRLIEG